MLTTLAIVAALAQTPAATETPSPPVRFVYPLPTQSPEPDWLERVTVGALLASSNVSIVPVWLTAACTTERTCTELNPIMRKVLGEGPIRASVVKAALSGVAHVGIWSIDAKTRKQQIAKLIAAVALLAFNTWDAINDVQVMRAIDRRLGR